MADVMSKEERSLWLLRKRLRDFERCARGEGLSVTFLTLTQSDKSIGEGYHWITGIMQAMKKQVVRSGAKMTYVAVLEIQPKRYKERGVLAPHWHIAIGCSRPRLFPHAEKNKNTNRIKKLREGEVVTWAWLHENVKQKLGIYFCCDCWSRSIYDYLGKYLAKGAELEDFRRKVGRRVRIFSSSRMNIDYQMTGGQKLERDALLADVPELSELYWRREGARIVARAKEVQDIRLLNNLTMQKISYPKIHSISGDWVVVENAAAPDTMGIGDQAQPQ